jgi:putative hydrolase of the HAD superfamily
LAKTCLLYQTLQAISNGNADVRLSPLLSPLFDFVVSPTEAGAAKPSPVPFWLAAATAQCKLSEIVHVGDSVTADLNGALAVGMSAVLVSRPDVKKDGQFGSAGGSQGHDPTLPPTAPTRWREVDGLDGALQLIRSGLFGEVAKL